MKQVFDMSAVLFDDYLDSLDDAEFLAIHDSLGSFDGPSLDEVLFSSEDELERDRPVVVWEGVLDSRVLVAAPPIFDQEMNLYEAANDVTYDCLSMAA